MENVYSKCEELIPYSYDEICHHRKKTQHIAGYEVVDDESEKIFTFVNDYFFSLT